MEPPFPSVTPTWHNASYSSIHPSRPELSMSGKTVIISGGGRGIGVEIVSSFACAKAARIHIIGRSASHLQSTKAAIEAKYTQTRVFTHASDVTNENRIHEIAKDIGSWDVLVLNAAYFSDTGKFGDIDISDWWQGFEVNVKGVAIALRAFLPARSQDATVIGVSSAAVALPSNMLLGNSSYVTSKLAHIKLIELLAAEYPDVHAVSVHPGVIETDMALKSKMDELPKDDIKLPADFIVWLASSEAKFLRGKFAWCNWDVDELIAKAESIRNGELLTTGLNGLSFT